MLDWMPDWIKDLLLFILKAFFIALAFIVIIVIGGLLFGKDLKTAEDKKEKEKAIEAIQKATIEEAGDFDKRFVTIEKFDYDRKIVLDVKEGCKYLSGIKTFSPLAKDGKFDCDKKYIEEYEKNKKAVIK